MLHLLAIVRCCLVLSVKPLDLRAGIWTPWIAIKPRAVRWVHDHLMT